MYFRCQGLRDLLNILLKKMAAMLTNYKGGEK